jgi:zinc transport system permease protein
MTFLQAILANPILQMAVLAALGASFASGMIGSYVVVKRIVSLSGSISHSVLSGMGAALWLQRKFDMPWLHPIYGALVAAILSALIIGLVHIYFREREDAVIAMIWSLGMAIGVIFVAQIPGFTVELTNFLLGNILWVSQGDLILLGAVDLLLLGAVFVYHKRFVALCFDEKTALLQGVKVIPLYLFLLTLVAVAVVVLIHVVGIILVITMLALPASIAGIFTRHVTSMMLVAIFLNVIFSIGGMALSYHLDWPTGATIALFASCVYLLSLRFRKSQSSFTP